MPSVYPTPTLVDVIGSLPPVAGRAGHVAIVADTGGGNPGIYKVVSAAWVLQSLATSVAWGSITGTPNNLTGYGITSPLNVAQGGSGAATFSAGVLHANGTAAFTSSLIVNADITVGTINLDKLAQSGGALNQVVAWNGSAWVATTITSGGIGSVPTSYTLTGTFPIKIDGSNAAMALTGTNRTISVDSATTGLVGVVQLAGDLAGDATSSAAPRVSAITGVAGIGALHVTALRYDASIVGGVGIEQLPAGAGNDGATMYMVAQNGGSGATIGGALFLSAGSGGSNFGPLTLAFGGTSTVSAALHPLSGFTFSSVFTTPKLTQASASSGTGKTFVVQAQPAATGEGGPLELRSGPGLSGDGEVRVFRGNNTTPSINVDTAGNLFFRQGLLAAGPLVFLDSGNFTISGAQANHHGATGDWTALAPMVGYGQTLTWVTGTNTTSGTIATPVCEIDFAAVGQWPDGAAKPNCTFAITGWIQGRITAGTDAGFTQKVDISGTGTRVAGAFVNFEWAVNGGSGALGFVTASMVIVGSRIVLRGAQGDAGRTTNWGGMMQVTVR